MDDYTLRLMMKERVADRQREAAAARLRLRARRSRPGMRAVVWDRLGNLLIRLGQEIKRRYGLGPETAECSGCRSRA